MENCIVLYVLHCSTAITRVVCIPWTSFQNCGVHDLHTCILDHTPTGPTAGACPWLDCRSFNRHCNSVISEYKPEEPFIAQCRYRRHREAILMCAVFMMLVLPRPIIGPFWLASMDSQRLRSPGNIIRLSGAQASVIAQIVFRCDDRTLKVPCRFRSAQDWISSTSF